MQRLTLLAIYILLFSSCSNDFLNLSPISSRNVEGFYTNEKELQQALIGIYDGLQLTQTPFYVMLLKEQRSDNSFQQSLLYSFHDIIHFTETADNTQLYPVWSNLYQAIYRCNVFLSKIEGVKFESDVNKSRMIAEAKSIRALLYFDLVRYFGGVPIVTTPITIEESFGLVRNSIEEVYLQIITDLEEASQNLPEYYSGSEVGRVDQYAAKSLLGKVYLTRSGYPIRSNDWDKARNLFAEVINSGHYEFFENYADIFDESNDNGKQSIWAVQFNSGVLGEGNPVPNNQAPNNIDKNDRELGISSGGSPYSPIVSNDLIEAYEPGDKRYSHTIQNVWLQNDGKLIENHPFSRKFANGSSSAQNTWDINWPIIRYTDVLMMYAECLNEIEYRPDGEAFNIINMVRSRAGLDPISSADASDQESFRKIIMQERRLEFAFEHMRWFDLVRTDLALPVMQNFLRPYNLDDNVTRDRYIYPIPSRVVQTNPLIVQNPGY